MAEVAGIAAHVSKFLSFVDAADVAGKVHLAKAALARVASAGTVDGALPPWAIRSLALRLLSHNEVDRLQELCASLAASGRGREGAFCAALLGDASLLEKVWGENGMLPHAALHAQVFRVQGL